MIEYKQQRCGSMSRPSKDNFEQALQIAEFASQRGEDRRQYEFKIFISYVTLLVLAIYEGHHIEDFSNNDALCGLFVLGLLFVMYFSYILWTISLSVANQNDSNRRNFYLQKSEYISVSLLKQFDDPLCRKMKSEYCHLCPDENKIEKVPNVVQAFKYGNHILINYAATFQVVLPTILFFLLVLNLSNELWTGWCRAAVILIPFLLFFPIMAISTYCRKKGAKRKHHERHKTS